MNKDSKMLAEAYDNMKNITLTFTPGEFQELLHILDVMQEYYNNNNQEYTPLHSSLARKIYIMSDKIYAKSKARHK